MSDSPFIIEALNLKKSYKKSIAVDDISFNISKGTCFGLLGPNGAGKTTTVEMLENILPPDSGTILYKGKKRDKQFNQEIGIQFQHTELLNYLTVEETLKTFAAFYKNPLSVKEILSLCNLENVRKNINNKISGGQRQRLLMGLALINNPELLFLDEPSTGLDPHARKNIWEITHSMKEQGKTIVLTTHYMEEAESLCNNILIIDEGLIIAQGTPHELIRTYCKDDKYPKNLEAVFLKITGKHLRK